MAVPQLPTIAPLYEQLKSDDLSLIRDALDVFASLFEKREAPGERLEGLYASFRDALMSFPNLVESSSKLAASKTGEELRARCKAHEFDNPREALFKLVYVMGPIVREAVRQASWERIAFLTPPELSEAIGQKPIFIGAKLTTAPWPHSGKYENFGRVVIMFGAGASFACENVEPRPPLGNRLFEAIASVGPASRLPLPIRQTFISLGFEAGMIRVFNETPEYIAPYNARLQFICCDLPRRGQPVSTNFWTPLVAQPRT